MKSYKGSNPQPPRTPRHGIQALYTFTPFKLLMAKQGGIYSLILAETFHHKAEPTPRWRSESVKDEFNFNVPADFSKKIVEPYDLYPIQFKKEDNKIYVYQPKDQPQWRYYPEYMEFSWDTLKGAYYCRFGFVLLSSSKNECPLASICPLRKGTPCKYYLGPIAYSSLYHVNPIIRKKYESPPDNSKNDPLAAIRYESMPLLTLSYIPNGSYVAFIDGVQFSPKLAKISKPLLLFLNEGLGFRIQRAPAIQFEFNKDTLNELIRDRLNSNHTLARWIRLKQLLYLGKDNTSDLIKENKGFAALNEMSEVVNNTLSKRNDSSTQTIIRTVNEAKIDDDLIEFASVLFVHSLSHLFMNWISARYGYGKGDFAYYLEHDRIKPMGLQKDGVRAFVFEAAVGGLGYLKSFAQDIVDSSNNILSEFFGSQGQGIQAALENCENRSNQAIERLDKELNNFSKDKQTAYLIDRILEAYKVFNDKHIYPHINSVRGAVIKIIDDENITNINISTDDIRGVMDDILDRCPHCWDGCQLCVMLEKGCNYLPFDQPFLVTSRLTLDIIKLLKTMTDSSEVIPLKIGVYKEFQRFVSTARYSIDLVSPWLSPEVVNELAKNSEENKLSIRIITSKDITNKTHEESLRILKEIGDRIKTRTLQQLHAKGMLVDGVMLLTGSFNFTISGLNSNVENLIVYFSSRECKNFRREFDNMWDKSQPLD